MSDIMKLAALLPEGVHWGDELTPQILSAAIAADRAARAEPFGYFKPEPFGWTDCHEDDDGAVALYEAPPAAPVVPECPFPCGWRKLHELMVRDAAWVSSKLQAYPDEPLPEHLPQIVFVNQDRALHVVRAMLAAPAGEQVGLTDAEVKEHFHHGSRTCKVSGPMNARDLAGIRQVIAAHEAKRASCSQTAKTSTCEGGRVNETEKSEQVAEAVKAERERIYALIDTNPEHIWRDAGFMQWRAKRSQENHE